jgi:hypothetical protein
MPSRRRSHTFGVRASWHPSEPLACQPGRPVAAPQKWLQCKEPNNCLNWNQRKPIVEGLLRHLPNQQQGKLAIGGLQMDFIGTVKGWVGSLTELGLMLIALGIVAALLSGDKVPFIGTVSGNIVKFVSDMGSAGLVGLISLGFIVWLFSNRKLS